MSRYVAVEIKYKYFKNVYLKPKRFLQLGNL